MKEKRKTKLSGVYIVLLVVLVLYVVSMLGLLLWGFMTSFKSWDEFRLNITGLPKKWIWNYSFVFSKYVVPISTPEGQVNIGMARMFLNAFAYAFGCAFTNTLVPCVTSYMCARYSYKFSKWIHAIVIVTMIIPFVGALPSEIRMAKVLGLYDHVWGLWIMKANFLGMYFLVFYEMFKSIPMTYTEAAMIDGAGDFSIMVKVIMPLAKNTFFTVMLINFITYWNDYQTPLVYLPSHPTIAIGLFEMAETTVEYLSEIPMRMSAAMLMLIPTLAVYLIFHKRLVGNLAVGGIKG